MRFKKDTFLDVIYSTLFAIVIMLENPALEISKSNISIVYIFKSLILISILILWMKALARNHSGALLIFDSSAKNRSTLKSGFNLMKEFVEMKICCYLLIFGCYSFFTNTFEFERIHYYLLQIFAVGFYTLSCFLISSAYFRISVNSWLFVILILGPYFLLFIMYGIFGSDSLVFFALVPSNLHLILMDKIGSPGSLIVLGLSLAMFMIMAAFLFKSINRLTNGPKYYNLQNGRVN